MQKTRSDGSFPTLPHLVTIELDPKDNFLGSIFEGIVEPEILISQINRG